MVNKKVTRRSEMPDMTEEEITEIMNQSKERNLIQIQKQQENWPTFRDILLENTDELLRMYYEIYVQNQKEITIKPPKGFIEFSADWEKKIQTYFDLNIKHFSCPYNPEAIKSPWPQEENRLSYVLSSMYEILLEDCLNNTSPQVRLTQWKTNQKTQKILEDSVGKIK